MLLANQDTELTQDHSAFSMYVFSMWLLYVHSPGGGLLTGFAMRSGTPVRARPSFAFLPNITFTELLPPPFAIGRPPRETRVATLPAA